MTIKEKCLFALKWAQNPMQMGAIFQTSNSFAKQVLKQTDWSEGYVIELGAGLGNLTCELVKECPDMSRFACVEIDSEFCKRLSSKFPEINIKAGSAADLTELFPHMIGKVKTIVSVLPLVSIKPEIRQAIFQSCLKMLAPDGVILQGSYYWKPIVQLEGLESNRVGFILKNMPPIHLYKYTRQ